MPRMIQNPIGYGLHYQLISFWNMEEASGNRVDSAPVTFYKSAANDLTAGGSPGNTTGKIGNAVSLVLASSQALTVASNSSLQMGSGVRCTIAFWVNFTTVATNQAILNKQNGGPVDEYRVILGITVIGGTQPGFQFGVSSAGTTYNANVSATNFGVISSGTWYFVVCQYDGTNISISVNNGTPNTTAFSADIFSGAAQFNIGKSNLAVQNFVNGIIDAVGIWKRVLNADEITYLYNGGNGRQWPLV